MLRACPAAVGQIHRALTDANFHAEGYDAARAERYARREGFYQARGD